MGCAAPNRPLADPPTLAGSRPIACNGRGVRRAIEVSGLCTTRREATLETELGRLPGRASPGGQNLLRACSACGHAELGCSCRVPESVPAQTYPEQGTGQRQIGDVRNQRRGVPDLLLTCPQLMHRSRRPRGSPRRTRSSAPRPTFWHPRVDRLLGPILYHGYDLVAPMYERHKFDGTITNSIAFPLTAALYGHRLRQPIGGDFGFSGRLAGHWARKHVWDTDVACFGVDIWMTTVALCEHFNVCQAILGAKLHDAKDPGRDLGPMFRQVVGSLFALAGRYADHWLAVDDIQPVRTFGFRSETSTEEIKVNHDRLLWRFVDGYVTYQDVWREVLGNDNLTQVRGAIHRAGERPDGFRLPVELWARICYDYLLAYNAQVVDHDELTNSLIPLYFARTATFIIESRGDSAGAAEERIESYAEVFRQAKPYLVRRFIESGRARRLADQRVSGDERRQGDDTSEFMAIKSP